MHFGKNDFVKISTFPPKKHIKQKIIIFLYYRCYGIRTRSRYRRVRGSRCRFAGITTRYSSLMFSPKTSGTTREFEYLLLIISGRPASQAFLYATPEQKYCPFLQHAAPPLSMVSNSTINSQFEPVDAEVGAFNQTINSLAYL